jgi:hypothetical protein
VPRRTPSVTQAPSLGALPDAAHAAILAALAAADKRALRRACRACRDAVDAAAGGVTVCIDLYDNAGGGGPFCSGAAPGRVRDVLRRFRGAAAIHIRGAAGGACQAGAVRLLAALSRWAGAEPHCRGSWPGVSRIAGCPSSCLPALAELCPNADSVELAAWDAGGVLLPDTVRALPSLSRLTELRITAGGAAAGDGRSGGDAEGGISPLDLAASNVDLIGALTTLSRLVIDTPLRQGTVLPLRHIAAPLTGLTHLHIPLSSPYWLSSLSALTGLRALVASETAFTLVALDGLPRFEHLTALECASRSLDPARLVPYTPEAPGLALARLEVPGAALGPAELSALAAACPSLTRLAALSLAALPADAPVPVLPELRELACSFDPQFSTPLTDIAPRLRRRELKAGEHGAPRGPFLVPEDAPGPGDFALDLVDPLSRYSPDGSFHFIDEDLLTVLHALKLTAPLMDGDMPNRGAAIQLFQACEAADPGERSLWELWLRTDQPALILGVAAGTIAYNIRALHLVSLLQVDVFAGPLIASVCVFRRLERLTLEEGAADGAPYPLDHVLCDAHLLQLEASRPDSLSRVTLRRARDVTREGADAAERRASARGVPLEVVMEECW